MTVRRCSAGRRLQRQGFGGRREAGAEPSGGEQVLPWHRRAVWTDGDPAGRDRDNPLTKSGSTLTDLAPFRASNHRPVLLTARMKSGRNQASDASVPDEPPKDWYIRIIDVNVNDQRESATYTAR